MDSGRLFRCTVVACASNQHNVGQKCNPGRNAPDAIADKSSMSASPTCKTKLRFKAKCHCLPDSGSPEGSGTLDNSGACPALSLIKCRMDAKAARRRFTSWVCSQFHSFGRLMRSAVQKQLRERVCAHLDVCGVKLDRGIRELPGDRVAQVTIYSPRLDLFRTRVHGEPGRQVRQEGRCARKAGCGSYLVLGEASSPHVSASPAHLVG